MTDSELAMPESPPRWRWYWGWLRHHRSTAQALVLVSLSFIGWGYWAMTKPYPTLFGGLSRFYSDHVSHMNGARLFARCGGCLWSQPVDQFLPHYTPEERRHLPDDIAPHMTPESDIFVVPGWPLDKPMMINWPFLPRPYPPGSVLLAAPVALVYHFTPLSFTNANRLLYLIYLLYAHLGFLLLLLLLRPGKSRLAPIGLLGGLLLYSESIHWAIEGFYDVALIAPCVLCGYYLRQRRGLAALLCYCVAAFIHYRAYFFAPLPVYALYLVVQEGKQQPWGVRQWAAVAAIVGLAGTSLYTFSLYYPLLSDARLPHNNVLRLDNNFVHLQLVVAGGLAMGALVYARAWMDVALLSWLAVILSLGSHTQPWHVLSPLLWLVLPIWTLRDERVALVRDVRLAVLWLVSLLVYGNSLAPSSWMDKL